MRTGRFCEVSRPLAFSVNRMQMECMVMLRVKEVASRLALSLSSVYQLIESGRLKSHCVAMKKGIRILEEDLSAFLESCRRSQGLLPATSTPKKSGTPFKHLNGERLRAAWRGRTSQGD